jgi:hypothetical protein
MRSLLVLAIVGIAGTAYAQAPSEVSEPVPHFEAKSTTSAYLITFASMFGPLAISAVVVNERSGGEKLTTFDKGLGAFAFAGVLLGPSAGHWYVGEGVTTGLALRLTGTAIFAGVAIGDPQMNHLGVWIAGGMTGLVLFEAGAAWDLITLRRSVSRYNKRQLDLQLAPMATPGGSGLSLVGTF